MAEVTKVNRLTVTGPIAAAAHVAKINRLIILGPAPAASRGQASVRVRYGEA